MIKVANVTHRIEQTVILQDINLSLDTNQVIALIGPNGAGKSTLFSVMSRLQPLQSGTISFDGLDIATTESLKLAKTVALLAQDNFLQGRLRVEELLMFGRYPYHQGRPQAHDKQIVEDVITRFELQGLTKRFISTLSGGQRQRVLIAMIVCQDTPYLLLDEPLNNLDIYHAGQLMRLLSNLVRTQNKTVVIVLHDINQASQFADTVVMMKAGKIVQIGHPSEVITQQSMRELYDVDITVLEHNGRPVIVDTV